VLNHELLCIPRSDNELIVAPVEAECFRIGKSYLTQDERWRRA